MDSQIEGYLLQLTSVAQDLPGIITRLSDAQFNWQPAADRWSIGQCIEHLNITTERYIPVVRQAMLDARAAGRLAPGPFALGVVERWFVLAQEPPVRRGFRTPKAFVAARQLDYDATLARWNRLQEQLADCIRASEGLDLAAIRVRSQFAPIKFTLNGTFAVLLAHERRHLWQAREVRKHHAFPEN
jgi:hypothetical protein